MSGPTGISINRTYLVEGSERIWLAKPVTFGFLEQTHLDYLTGKFGLLKQANPPLD